MLQRFYGGDLANCENSYDKLGRTAQVSGSIETLYSVTTNAFLQVKKQIEINIFSLYPNILGLQVFSHTLAKFFTVDNKVNAKTC